MRAAIFFFIQLQNRPFKDIAFLNLMDAGLFKNFLGTQAIILILRCFTAKIFIFKNCQPPPPLPESTVRPLTKKRDQFQPFPNSTDCHTKHIAMPHGVWPSKILNYRHWKQIPVIVEKKPMFSYAPNLAHFSCDLFEIYVCCRHFKVLE